MKIVKAFLILLLLCVVPSGIAFSQSSGELTGVVSDRSQAVIPHAKLELKNTQQNTVISGETDGAGLFRFTGLNPSHYTLSVTAPGFATTLVKEIQIQVNRITDLNVAMDLAQTSSTVEVSASEVLLETGNGTKGTQIDIEAAMAYPLETRNPLQLSVLTAGVHSYMGSAGADSVTRQGNDGTAISARYMLNGGVYSANGGWSDVVVDGISVTSQREGVVQALPPADALQEARIQSGGMGSEVGRTVGGVMNFVTRSGANNFHGKLYYTNRNTATAALRALPYGAVKAVNNFHQFGGTFGGPVLLPHLYNGRNKTFFFLAYDGTRWLRKNPTLDTVPTVKMRAGDFSELSVPIYDPQSSSNPAQRTAFPKNQMPSARFNAIGQSMVGAFPLPTRTGIASNFDGQFRVLTPIDDYVIRIDHAFSDRQRLMGRVTWVNSINDSTGDLGVNDGGTSILRIPMQNVTLNYSYAFTPQLLYTTAGGFTHFKRTLLDPTGNSAGASFFNFSVTPQPPAYENIRPIVTWDIYNGIGGASDDNELVKTWQWNQQLAWVRGKHTLRVGTDLRWFIVGGLLTSDAPNGSFGFNPLQTSRGTTSTGSSVASALLGLPNTTSFGQPPLLSARKTAPALYVGDDYVITPEVTVNFGIRFDYEGGISESQNRIGYFDSAQINSVVHIPGVFRYASVNGTPNSIADTKFSASPRVGFAWSPKFVPDFVVRGAFGTYNGPVPMVGAYSAAAGFEPLLQYVKPSTTAAATSLQASYSLPSPTGPLGDAAYLGQSVSQIKNRQFSPPRVYEWNLGIQKQMPWRIVWETTYTGNRGTHLLRPFNLNIPPQAVIQHAIDLTNSTGSSTAATAYLNQSVANPLAGLVPGTLGNPTVTLVQASVPFPQYSSVTPIQNIGDSIYHSLQTTLQKQMGANLRFLVTYSYSKVISSFNSLQNPYNLRDGRAVDPFDQTHMFASSSTLDLPFGPGQRFLSSGWAAYAFGGFHIDHIMRIMSGQPIAVTETSNGLGVGTSRPDALGNPAAASKAIRGTKLANGNIVWLDPSSFKLATGRFGTAPAAYSNLRQPGFWQVDLAVGRDFRLTKELVMRFNAQAFNAFNHTNPVGVVTNVNSNTFGQISAAADPRVLQFGLEFNF